MKKKILIIFLFGCFGLIGLGIFLFFKKYEKSAQMIVRIEEITTDQYPEDPARRSVYYNQYVNRSLKLTQKSPTHFDFEFFSSDSETATIKLKDIDLSLIIPSRPEWTKDHKNNQIVALVDREWNRQQVRFMADSKHVKIFGGDGFEQENLYTVELARNCLNAGLWEIILTTKEQDQKAVYYQGWFNFPLGHYKDIFENINSTSYFSHWYRLEHWFDPHLSKMDLGSLRKIVKQQIVKAQQHSNNFILVSGEQRRKKRTLNAKGVQTWEQFCTQKEDITFATFVPPGRYSVKHPWKNEFDRIKNLEKVLLRKIVSPNKKDLLDEIELVFKNNKNNREINRFIVSGIDFQKLPIINTDKYHKGLYMPMGIAVPPFYQSYEDLKQNPPKFSPYFSVLINDEDQWLNHHEAAIDGPVIHRDAQNPQKIHVYLLSYERHSLVAHIEFELPKQWQG